MKLLRAPTLRAFVPIVLLLAGVVGKDVIRPTTRLALRAPLSAFPESLGGFTVGSTGGLSDGERRVLRADDYIVRRYQDADGRRFSLFVAYYAELGSGSSIHSPRNCLPGSGWEPIGHDRIVVDTPYGPNAVNRYVVEHSTGARSLVFYWYQGRGRETASDRSITRLPGSQPRAAVSSGGRLLSSHHR